MDAAHARRANSLTKALPRSAHGFDQRGTPDARCPLPLERAVMAIPPVRTSIFLQNQTVSDAEYAC